jgi:Histidyl-tRNA synthetase
MSGFSRWGQMSERKQFRAIKGTRDIRPPDSALWNWFEHTAREVFESYNFGEIRLPIFEETELFARSIGLETDVVSKEMFSFEDRGTVHVGFPQTVDEVVRSNEAVQAAWQAGRIPRTLENDRRVTAIQQESKIVTALGTELQSKELLTGSLVRFIAELHSLTLGDRITLRPEATASVCRAYIEHNMQALPGNQKLYYIGPMFRRERPQKGRYRQFYQIGAEVLGQSDAPAIDAEVLEMLLVFFNRVGLTRTTLYVNSIGDKNCRPQYVELLREELRKVKDKLKEDSQRRIETNPLRVLDSKIPEEQPIIETLPRISDHLCDECRAHFAKLKELAPRPRARLLHAHHIRSHRRRTRLAERRLRWRPLRRSRRTPRRTANKRHRLCHRHRPLDSFHRRKRQRAKTRRPRGLHRMDGSGVLSHSRQHRKKIAQRRALRRAAARGNEIQEIARPRG